MRLPVLAAATLATVALASACGSSNGGLIPTDTAGSLTTDLTNIQAGVVAGDCAVTNAAIESARIDFEDLPTTINSGLRSQLVQGFNTLVLSAELKCRQSAGGGQTGPTGSSSSSSSSTTTSSTTTTSTSSAATSTSSAATTTSSSAATTATTTGPSCTLITTPNGGTVCQGSTGDTSSNGIGGGGGIGGPGT